MQFICKYHGPAPYYKTVHADSINEATKLGERYKQKGYILETVTQKEGS